MLATLLSAILIVLSFPPWNLAPLIWIALVPWLLELEKAKHWKRKFGLGVALSFWMSVGGFAWVAYAIRQNAGAPWPLAILGMLLFALFNQWQFPLFAMLRGRRFTAPLAAAALYTSVDWLLPKLFVDTLGHSLHASEWLRQAADIGGVPLLTFSIVLVNLSLASIWRTLRNRGEPSLGPALRSSIPDILVCALILGFLCTYGFFRERAVTRATLDAPQSVQMAAIQANIGDFDKIASESGVRGAAEKILSAYEELSEEALRLSPRPQVLIWPETAYPSTFRTPETAVELERDQRLERWVREIQTPLIFGGYDHFEDKDFNALFYLTPTDRASWPGSGDLKIYRKNILLLFGEYIPGMKHFPFLQRALPQIANFGRGEGPAVVDIPLEGPVSSVLSGPIICYEALFSEYIRAAVRKGSQLILNVTNDSWFGPWGEPDLHFALTVFRSIESRVPQLRATNTGISALVLPSGEVIDPTPTFVPRVLNVRVPLLRPIPSLFLWWGDFLARACVLLTLIWALAPQWVAYWRRRHSGI